MSEFDFIKEMQDNTPEEVKIYVKTSMDILDRLHELMEEKNVLQKELAEKLNKSEAEISKWLNGMQNFTIKTLSKLSAALGETIIEVPCHRNSLKTRLSIETYRHEGVLTQNTSTFKKFESKTTRQEASYPQAA